MSCISVCEMDVGVGVVTRQGSKRDRTGPFLVCLWHRGGGAMWHLGPTWDKGPANNWGTLQDIPSSTDSPLCARDGKCCGAGMALGMIYSRERHLTSAIIILSLELDAVMMTNKQQMMREQLEWVFLLGCMRHAS
jgi:hypothetical protein